jgi:predicted CoA-binding protein
MASQGEMRNLLTQARTIAVVGLSDKPERASHSVAAFLQRQGYRIVPVNPMLQGPVLGEQPYASLREVPLPIDIVDIFRRSEFVGPIVDTAIEIGAKAVWMQLGVIDQQAAERARRAGLVAVVDHCIAVEYRKLMG